MLTRRSSFTAVILSAGLALSAASPAVAKDRDYRTGVYGYGSHKSAGHGQHRSGRRIIVFTDKYGNLYATGVPARGYPIAVYPTGKGYATGMAPKSSPAGNMAGGMPAKDQPAADTASKDDTAAKDEPAGDTPSKDDTPAKDESAGDTTGDATPPASDDAPAATAPVVEPPAGDGKIRKRIRQR